MGNPDEVRPVEDGAERLRAETERLLALIARLAPGHESELARLYLARVTLNHTFQFIGLCDIEGRLWEANQTALDGAGIDRSDIHGRPFWEAKWWQTSADARLRLKDGIERAASGEFVRYDVEVYGSESGSGVITVDFNINPVHDAAGQVVFLIVEGRDVTDQRAAEREVVSQRERLAESNERLHDLDDLKSQFFANISHELRTPLALVLGPAQRLMAKADHEDRRALDLILGNARLVLKHVNDLLDVAKLDAGHMQVAYARIDLGRTVRLIADRFEGIAEDKQIGLHINAPDDVTLPCDPDMVDRILANLLSNAFKFTPDGGRVEVRLTHDGDEVHLEVADSGPGIPEGLRKAVFERFRQVDGGTGRRFGGTGLGLAIVKEFVALHHGDVHLEESGLGGARFVVTLPSRAPQGVPVKEGRPPELAARDLVPVVEALREDSLDVEISSPQDPARATVLVVEDNAQMRAFVEQCLAVDHNVITATDGAAALRVLETHIVDLVVTDIMMPRVPGDALVRRIRERSELDGLPIVLLTAKADDALRVRVLSDGAQDYVQKPFQEAELRARVRNLVEVKRARDVLRRAVGSERDGLWALADTVSRRLLELRHVVEDTR